MEFNLFSDFFYTMDDTLLQFTGEAITNMAGYVKTAVPIFSTVVLILLAVQHLWAPFEQSFTKLIGMFAMIAIVSVVATEAAVYNSVIGSHLLQLPDDLLRAMATSSDMDSTDDIGSFLDTAIGSMMTAIADIFRLGAWNDIGPYLVGMLMFVLLCALGAAAVISITVGKVGIAIVVALGPLMILGLLSPVTKDFFTKWVSYALSFAILQVMIGAVILIATRVLRVYVIALASQTTELGNLVPMLAPGITMLVLTYLFWQLPSMASSLMGGIGLAAGNAAWGMTSGAASRLGWQMGGKQMAAHHTAAGHRRVEASMRRQQERADGRRAGISALAQRVTGGNSVRRGAGERDAGQPSSRTQERQEQLAERIRIGRAG